MSFDPISYIASHGSWEALMHAGKHGLALLNRKPIDNWLPLINHTLQGEAEILVECARFPVLENTGNHVLTSNEKEYADEKRAALRQNDPHALVSTDTIWRGQPLIKYTTTDYAGVSAMRALGKLPAILSANAVLICPESRLIIVHRRSASSATYGNYLHTLGGAYIPQGTNALNDVDRKGLSATVGREIFEETQIRVDPESKTIPLVCMREISTGFIQLTCLGLTVSPNALLHMKANWEGELVTLSFDDLESQLLRSDWVPTARAGILAWLAFDAPGSGWRPRFSGKTPRQLFQSLVSSS
jgi:hypothetical protein